MKSFAYAALAAFALCTACTSEPISTGDDDGDDGGDDGGDDVGVDAAPVSGRVTEGLAALYEFDGTAGQTTVADTSGVGAALDLTISTPANVTWGAGFATITAPTLIASGPATKIQTACAASDEVTLEVWVKPATLTTNGRILASSIGGDRNFLIKQQDATYQTRVRTSVNINGQDPESQSGANTAKIDAPQHIVTARYDDGFQDSWIDGVKQPSVSNGGNQANWDATYSVSIASDGDGGSPWTGDVYLAAVYCRALSQAEVRKNYDEGY